MLELPRALCRLFTCFFDLPRSLDLLDLLDLFVDFPLLAHHHGADEQALRD
jgi:hypothetical protein